MPSPRLLPVNHTSTGACAELGLVQARADASAYLFKDRCFEEGPLRAGLT